MAEEAEVAAQAASVGEKVATEAVKQLTSDERLKTILADMVEKATSGVSDAVDWTVAQVPDLIHQLLLWNMLLDLFWCVFAIMIILTGMVFIPRFLNKLNGTLDRRDTAVFKFMSVAFGLVIGVPIFIPNFLEAVKIFFAPKLWLLEYAVTLVMTTT